MTSLLACPQTVIPTQTSKITIDSPNLLKEIALKNIPFTYDDILELLDEVENGDPTKFTIRQLELISQYFTHFASCGINPNDDVGKYLLEYDSQELLSDSSSFIPALYYDVGSFDITHSIYYGERHAVHCKSWCHKKWKHIKHFCAKHKKAIIIGTVVVIATVGVVTLVAAASGTAASALGAAGTAGAGALSSNDSHHNKNPLIPQEPQYDAAYANNIPLQENQISDEIQPEIPTIGFNASSLAEIAGTRPPATFMEVASPPNNFKSAGFSTRTTTPESTLLNNVIDNYVYTFKDDADRQNNISPYELANPATSTSFEESLRSAGSILAHNILDGIQELSSFVPGILDEGKYIQDRYMPEWMRPSTSFAFDQDEDDLSYMERYHNRITSGHEVIDNIFSTDYANSFSEESRLWERENYSYGIMPPPQLGAVGTETAFALEAERIPPTLASNTCGWSVGQDITNRTAWGNVPKWSTVRKRYWKNQAEKVRLDPNKYTEYNSPENLIRMENGLAPQRLNLQKKQMESMELHHMPPQREGGLFDFVELWPNEHVLRDKFRFLGK